MPDEQRQNDPTGVNRVRWWKMPGMTFLLAIALLAVWYGISTVWHHGRFSLFIESLRVVNATVTGSVILAWLVCLLIQGNLDATRLSASKDKLDLYDRQLVGFFAGLVIVVQFTAIAYAMPGLVPKPQAEELILVGSGTVLNWLKYEKQLNLESDVEIGGHLMRVRALEGGSTDGIHVMASAHNHGRRKESPTVVAMASYDVQDEDEALGSDGVPRSFFRIKLYQDSGIFMIRHGKGCGWPPIKTNSRGAPVFEGDPLEFLEAHLKAGKVYAGGPGSGTRLDLEAQTAEYRCRDRKTNEAMTACAKEQLPKVKAEWNKLNQLPASLDLRALDEGACAVVYGNHFAYQNRGISDDAISARGTTALEEVTHDPNWDPVMIPLSKPRPLLLVGRIDGALLTDEVCDLLRGISWHGEFDPWHTCTIESQGTESRILEHS